MSVSWNSNKMAASHEGVLHGGCTGCRQMACNDEFIACPLSKTAVGVWWIPDLSKKPFQLSGHKKLITCVCFGNKRTNMLLCSVSEDLIYIWNVTRGYANYSSGCHEEAFSPLCVGKDLGSVQHISFNSSDFLISACIGKEVWVLNVEKCKLESVLEGHISQLTQAQFCPWSEFMIISIAEDRTFKVWDIQQSCLLYQSPIVSGFPFISLAFDSTQCCIALGATDGKVRIYELSEDSSYRCLHEIDIGQQLQRNLEKQKEDLKIKGPAVISSNPSWKKEDFKQEIKDDNTSMVDIEAGTSVLGLQFIMIPGKTAHAQKTVSPDLPFLNATSQSHINDIFHVPSILVVGMTASIVLVNCSTWDILYVLDFKVPIISSNELGNVQYNLPTAGLYTFAEKQQNMVQCLVGSLFNNAVHVISIRIPMPEKDKNAIDALASRLSETTGFGTQGVCDTFEQRELQENASAGLESDQSVITVLSSVPLHANSPLKAELLPKGSVPAPAKKTPKRGPSTKGKTSLPQDQPLTFKSKVKSSGYTDAPRSTMFSPKTNLAKKSSPSLKKIHSKSSSGVVVKEYPTQSNPPTQLKQKLSLTSQPTAINCITYSSNGRHLACALSNKSAHILRLPPSSNKETVLTGHDGSLSHVQFSHDNKWVLTSSTDRTVRLWSPMLSDPLLTFSTINHNFNLDSDAKTKKKDNPLFPKEINQASFYYVDKFILVSCGNGLYLYKYHIDPLKDDIKRYQSHSKYKLVKLFQQERAQNITCFSCINGFHSYITLCCGSNKSIEVLDMNVGRSIRVLMDAHTRPVHAICQNQGSAYASHSPEAYDLFLTAAVSDGIKLWDLRANRCVRRYEGHVNRSHPTGLAISPCSRYIATGSEDRSVYLFDVRGSSFCHRLTGHTEVVFDVAFHPAQCELAAASLDGKLKFYTD